MKKTLIIYAHPYKKSFNHAILEELKKILEDRSTTYEVIDLYQDNFDPRYTVEELALFSQGKTLDPLVTAYQKKLKTCNKVIIVAPIWWNDIPAILKGFFDKVMKQSFSYEVTPIGLKGKLTNIHTATVITTSTSPTWYLRIVSGNAVKRAFLNATLKQIGIQKRRWLNFGSITGSSQKRRELFLINLKNQVK